ncbi:hypothetical protein AMECASPLE_011893 [Ameca splendens]|uniref:Uncharacterized protein n=1 Tax=Ameca splendens TaxID=208324 RepID=A0ABV0YZ54_9TELE
MCLKAVSLFTIFALSLSLSLSLSLFLFLILSPSLSLSFCVLLIKKPSHADCSEQITIQLPYMFEVDRATGAVREKTHSDRSLSCNEHNISILHFLHQILFILFILFGVYGGVLF